jgi:hypothetical protein
MLGEDEAIKRSIIYLLLDEPAQQSEASEDKDGPKSDKPKGGNCE